MAGLKMRVVYAECTNFQNDNAADVEALYNNEMISEGFC